MAAAGLGSGLSVAVSGVFGVFGDGVDVWMVCGDWPLGVAGVVVVVVVVVVAWVCVWVWTGVACCWGCWVC